MELKSFLTVLLISGIPLFSSGQSISVTGSWTPPVSPPTEAGNDYSSTPIVSDADQTRITIGTFLLLTNYTIKVHKSDGGNWHGNLVLEVQRTGTGTGVNIGNLSGGLSYQPVTDTPMDFFYYASLLNLTAINNIPIRYRLSGLSVLLPAKDYTTTVMYTISN